MEQWYRFASRRGSTSGLTTVLAYYGYGTEREAEIYLDMLNRKMTAGNCYTMDLVTDEGAIARLDSGDDTDGFWLDLAISAQIEMDKDREAEEARLYGDDAMPSAMSNAIQVARALAEREGKDFGKLSDDEWIKLVMTGFAIWQNSGETDAKRS